MTMAGAFATHGRHHMAAVPVEDGGGQWACVECGARGTADELERIDCPKGMRPYYPEDYPDVVELAERDMGTHIQRFVVRRMMYYERDDEFERALNLKNSSSSQVEVHRRLGALGDHWRAYSKIDGGYIGTLEEARRLIDNMGIAPQLSPPRLGMVEPACCSIGFCAAEQKWYGWSHRACYGFGIGYVAEEGHETTAGSWAMEDEDEQFDRSVSVGFECKTLDDCKLCAIAYADAVG